MFASQLKTNAHAPTVSTPKNPRKENRARFISASARATWLPRGADRYHVLQLSADKITSKRRHPTFLLYLPSNSRRHICTTKHFTSFIIHPRTLPNEQWTAVVAPRCRLRALGFGTGPHRRPNDKCGVFMIVRVDPAARSGSGGGYRPVQRIEAEMDFSLWNGRIFCFEFLMQFGARRWFVWKYSCLCVVCVLGDGETSFVSIAPCLV